MIKNEFNLLNVFLIENAKRKFSKYFHKHTLKIKAIDFIA